MAKHTKYCLMLAGRKSLRRYSITIKFESFTLCLEYARVETNHENGWEND